MSSLLPDGEELPAQTQAQAHMPMRAEPAYFAFPPAGPPAAPGPYGRAPGPFGAARMTPAAPPPAQPRGPVSGWARQQVPLESILSFLRS